MFDVLDSESFDMVILDIEPVEAEALLKEYCCVGEAYAWPGYDADWAPTRLSGCDFASPALLQYPIPTKILTAFNTEGSPYWQAGQAMRHFVEFGGETEFKSLDRQLLVQLVERRPGDDVSGPTDWRNLVACLDAVQATPKIWSTAVTKILHRKRPDLVPINDSRLRAFYGVSNSYAELWGSIHDELQSSATVELLGRLAADRVGLDGRPMTILRTLDIVAWMYMEPARVKTRAQGRR
ncbi:MAG TPA: DUF6308 family protein [Acidimicrobiales bacterium]|nr:DUF6308 family protein [Acidimicrobiales bacterium]